MEPRPLMEEAYERLAGGDVAVAVAPTGYGKTAASPWMYRRALEDGLAGGLIHVAPLRALLWGAFKAFFEPAGGRLQMHGAPEGVRSPYFLSGLVAATLDSYLWNLYRVPVAEALKVERGVSMGHYYPALAAIFTSVNVFDEAHMYPWEDPAAAPGGIGVGAVEAALSLLSHAGVPVAVETATVRPAVAGSIAEKAGKGGRGVWVGVLAAPSRAVRCPYLDALRGSLGGLGGVRVSRVEDGGWEAEKLVPWRTRVARGGWDGVLGEVAEEAGRGPVLVVANTVGEAVRVYARLSRLVGRAVLVHGRMAEGERRRAEEEIGRVERGGGVVVATQAAEAGVDVNSLSVYTAPAPLESLVQRAGRACRRGGVLGECMGRGGRVVVVEGASLGPYDGDEVASTLRLVAGVLGRLGEAGINWRATCDGEGFVGYATLLARAPRPVDVALFSLEGLLKAYLAGDAQPWVLLRHILDDVCGLARDTVLAEVDVGGDRVVVSLEWLLSHAEEVLEAGPSGAPVIVVEAGGDRVEAEARRLWAAWRSGRGGCRRIVRGLLDDVSQTLKGTGRAAAARAYFKARPGAYQRGLGLLLPRERPSSGV